jgi:hypothetical protein
MKSNSYVNLIFLICLTWFKEFDKVQKLYNYWLGSTVVRWLNRTTSLNFHAKVAMVSWWSSPETVSVLSTWAQWVVVIAGVAALVFGLRASALKDRADVAERARVAAELQEALSRRRIACSTTAAEH